MDGSGGAFSFFCLIQLESWRSYVAFNFCLCNPSPLTPYYFCIQVCELYPQHRTFLADELALVFLKQQQLQGGGSGGGGGTAASSRRKHSSLRAYSLLDSDQGNDCISMVSALLMHLIQAAAFIPAIPEPAPLQEGRNPAVNPSGMRKTANKKDPTGLSSAEGKGKRSIRGRKLRLIPLNYSLGGCHTSGPSPAIVLALMVGCASTNVRQGAAATQGRV